MSINDDDKVVSLGHYLDPRSRRGGQLYLPLNSLKKHCAVIAPSGSGKTESIIIPWTLELLQQGASVITIDVKGDLITRLGNSVQNLGCRLWYWNPGDPACSHKWNWLDEIDINDDRDVEAAVNSLLRDKPKAGSDQYLFYLRDCKWLRAFIKIAKELQFIGNPSPTPSNIYNLIADRDGIIDKIFNRYPFLRNKYLGELKDLLDYKNTEGKYALVTQTLRTDLDFFKTSRSVAYVCNNSQFSLRNIDEHPTLLVIGASLASGQQSATLSSLILNLMFNCAYRRFEGSEPRRRSWYFMIDESSRLKDRINFEEVLSMVRSADVGICLAAQNVNQFGNEREFENIFDNCDTFITLKKCTASTAEYFSKRLGQRTETITNVSKTETDLIYKIINQDWQDDREQRTTSTKVVPVLGTREIMYPPIETYCAVVQVRDASAKPFLVDLQRETTNPVPNHQFLLKIGGKVIRLNYGTKLLEQDISGLKSHLGNNIVAGVSCNPNNANDLVLTNLSNQSWIVVYLGGQQNSVPVSGFLKLEVGARINFVVIQGEIC
ncbi:MAG: type IV secretory system conjugative DNA transfer family protein [Crocosphaera sp.]